MKLSIATLLALVCMVGEAHAQPLISAPSATSSELEFAGVSIGKPLALPACESPGDATDAVSLFPRAHNGSEISCWFPGTALLFGPDSRVVRLSEKDHAAHAYLRQDFRVDVKDGRVVGITILTAGDRGPEQALQILKEKLGQPNSREDASVTGVKAGPGSVEWNFPDRVIHFSGDAPAQRVRVIAIEDPAWHNRSLSLSLGEPLFILGGMKDDVDDLTRTHDKTEVIRAISVLLNPAFALKAAAKNLVGDHEPMSETDPGLAYASLHLTCMATGADLDRVRWLLAADDAALANIAPDERKAVIDARNRYSQIYKGAVLALSTSVLDPPALRLNSRPAARKLE